MTMVEPRNGTAREETSIEKGKGDVLLGKYRKLEH